MPKEAPRAPGKKLKIKLARDAGNSGPDLVSVRKIIESSYQLPRAQQLSRRENQPCLGVPLISQLSCQPLEMATTSGFLPTLVESADSGQVCTPAQKRQSPQERKWIGMSWPRKSSSFSSLVPPLLIVSTVSQYIIFTIYLVFLWLLCYCGSSGGGLLQLSIAYPGSFFKLLLPHLWNDNDSVNIKWNGVCQSTNIVPRAQ